MICRTSRYSRNNWSDLKNRVIASLEELMNKGSIDRATLEVMLSLINNATVKEEVFYERKRSKDN